MQGKESGQLEPQNLVIWPFANVRLLEESGKFLKDYCFPNGVKVHKIPFAYLGGKVVAQPGDRERFFKHWYGQKSYREKCINIILNPHDSEAASQLNCLCVKTKEIKYRSSDGQAYLVERMQCFLSWNCFFKN